MAKYPFQVGDLVTYTCSATGTVTPDAFVTFVCSDYISVCTHEWPDEDTLHGYKQVNVVVSRSYWNTITSRTNAQDTKTSTCCLIRREEEYIGHSKTYRRRTVHLGMKVRQSMMPNFIHNMAQQTKHYYQGGVSDASSSIL